MQNTIRFDMGHPRLDIELNEGYAACSLQKSDEGAVLTIDVQYNGAYGMGEKYNALNQKGLTAVNTIEEKFCNQGEKTYCAMPFFVIDTGLGVYVNTTETTSFEFAEGEIIIRLPENTEVTFFTGSISEIISEYMQLFGGAKLPPKWAFGPWMSANRWNTQKQVEQQLKNLREYDFPATVLVVEAWSDEATFYIFNGAKYTPVQDGKPLKYSDFSFAESSFWSDPKGMIEELHANGVHLVLWQIPVYKKQTEEEQLCKQNELDRECAIRQGMCVKNKDGTPYTIPEGHWFAGSMIPDFTNAAAVKMWFDKRKYLLDIGVDGFKTDGGEFVYTDDVLFADGATGKQGKNRYAQSYTEAYSGFLPDNHTLFSRAGGAGQHTTPILWAGDQQSVNSELRGVLSAGLSAALSGIPFWSFDIAGFAGPLPTADLYRRSTQLACFVPVMQWHSEPDGGQFKDLLPGGEGNNERSPWNIGDVYNTPQLVDEMRFWYKLRMNLLPYIYSEALSCVKNSRPMIRPLVYAFSGDQACTCIDDEFMLGESLLVAPLMEENSDSRSVYIPKGEWHNLFTRDKLTGGKSYTIKCDDKLPVFIRSGTALALNLGAEKTLGSDVGNRVDKYNNLHFILCGESGSYSFSDDLGNDFTLSWHGGQVETSGTAVTEFTTEII